MRTLLACLFSALAALAIPGAQAQTPAATAAYALLVAGQPGQAPYDKWYDDWTARFGDYLRNKANVPGENIAILSKEKATSEAILAGVASIAGKAGPNDQVIVFIVGHGEINQAPTLTLTGPDLSAEQLAAALAPVKSQNQVILHFGASSGSFLKDLSAPNRVNITATSPAEIDEPIFAEFFLRGLESGRADADANGSINLLEAFNWAATQTTYWIARWQQTSPPSPEATSTKWKASGKETIEIFEKLYAGIPTRVLDSASDRNAADAPAEIQPADGKITAEWSTRRIIDEHAMLEDTGQGIGVAILGLTGLQPVTGAKAGDPGHRASLVHLGIPQVQP